MKDTVIIFETKELADMITKEIAVTPHIEGDAGPVWVWYDPDDEINVVKYKLGADGRCAMAHPFSEAVYDWLDAYLDEWIQTGQVQLLDALPTDWQYLTDPEN